MSTSTYSFLVPRIHTTVARSIVEYPLIHKVEKLCLLNYLGAEKYFINTNGFVWSRDILLTKKPAYQGYLPMVMKDKKYRTPWVLLPTKLGKIWFPVINLLGWSFAAAPDTDKKFYKEKVPSIILDIRNLENSAEAPAPEDSLYMKFINELYSK